MGTGRKATVSIGTSRRNVYLHHFSYLFPQKGGIPNFKGTSGRARKSGSMGLCR